MSHHASVPKERPLHKPMKTKTSSAMSQPKRAPNCRTDLVTLRKSMKRQGLRNCSILCSISGERACSRISAASTERIGWLIGAKGATPLERAWAPALEALA